ncbi:MAG: spermidine synthase [Wolinella sp.]
MWITRQDGTNFQEEFAISHKLIDARSSENVLEIFKSHAFDEIALINQKQLFLKQHLHQTSELLAHIPLCVHENTNHLLLADEFNLEVAHEALKHEQIYVDFLQNDEKILRSFISFFPHFQSVINHARFSLLSEESSLKTYEIIITNAKNATRFLPFLSSDGIMILGVENPLLHEESLRQTMQNLANNFSILMPFHAPFSFPIQHYLFASRRFHPTADLILQRADMLDGLRYYHSRIHKSAFILPRFLEESIRGIAKN